MKILGVDLGSYSIKVAELDASPKGYVLNNFFEFPLSVDPNRDRALEIIDSLRTLSQNYDPKNTKWVIGVPQHRVSVHHKRFPFRERSKIYKSLAFELEDDIPLDIDETIFDFKIIEFLGPSADVLTVAAPKEAVEEALNISKDGGFDSDIVSVEGLALANLFESWNEAPKEISPSLRPTDESTSIGQAPTSRARLILHLGHTRSLLLVYRDGGLVSIRSILWGGSEIASAISAAFNVSIFESMKVLNEKSFILMNRAGATKDQIKLSDTVATQVDNLLRELRLTLLEVKAAFALEYDQIELMGGASQIQNLGPYITQGLEISANLASQSAMADKPSRVTMTPQMEAIAGVAVGLAIEGMKRPRNPALNLRREEFARENSNFKEFWSTWRVPVTVAATAFALFFVFSIVRDQIASGLAFSSEEKITEAATKAAGLRGSAATENGLNAYIRNSKNRIKNHEAVSQLDDYVSAMEIVAKLSEKFPPKAASGQPGVDVTLLEVVNDDVTIQGHAANRALVTDIEKAINEMARPQSRKPGPVQAGTVPGVPFSYTFKVNRKP